MSAVSALSSFCRRALGLFSQEPGFLFPLKLCKLEVFKRLIEVLHVVDRILHRYTNVLQYHINNSRILSDIVYEHYLKSTFMCLYFENIYFFLWKRAPSPFTCEVHWKIWTSCVHLLHWVTPHDFWIGKSVQMKKHLHTEEVLCTVTILTPSRRVTMVGLTLEGSHMSHSSKRCQASTQNTWPLLT